MFDPQSIEKIEAAMQAADYPLALKELELLQKTHPGDPLLMNKMGHVFLRMGDLARARKCYSSAGNALEDALIPVFSGLAELECREGNMSAASKHGSRSLELKSAQAIRNQGAFTPPRWIADADGTERLICYSLYGSDPKYMEGAIANAGSAGEFFPEFKCRFYIDDSLPGGVGEELTALGAELVVVSGAARNWHPTMWRFLALDDPAAAVVMLRDADSPFSERERSMVTAWLESEKHAHVIRDWYAHTPLILAGLFGIQGGRLGGISASIDAYLSIRPKQWGVDQAYLGDVIWPVIHEAALVHAAPFEPAGESTFPPPENINEHVGLSLPLQTVASNETVADGASPVWVLEDASGFTREYPAIIDGGKATIQLPAPICEAVQSKQMTLQLRA